MSALAALVAHVDVNTPETEKRQHATTPLYADTRAIREQVQHRVAVATVFVTQVT